MHSEALPRPLDGTTHKGSAPARPRALFILDAASRHLIYGEPEMKKLGQIADFYGPPQTRDTIKANPALLSRAEVIFSGWGAPIMDEAFLQAAPNLKAVFYGAGTVGYCTTDAFWERDIIITSAYAANAVPVAEYTLAAILLSLKKFWQYSTLARKGSGWDGNQTRDVPGCFRRTVAVIGCGAIGRRLIELLKPFDLRRIAYDPYLTGAEASLLGVELCGSLEEAFAKGDVVTLHTPDKPSTRGMITGQLFASMKRDATFINTARAAIVRQDEMEEVLSQRPDLTAVLDVTDPEPPPDSAPLLHLPNVVITPHIAGSHAGECERLGQYMVEEFERYLAGQPLRWQVTRELVGKLA